LRMNSTLIQLNLWGNPISEEDKSLARSAKSVVLGNLRL
jgi:hypothetical protein